MSHSVDQSRVQNVIKAYNDYLDYVREHGVPTERGEGNYLNEVEEELENAILVGGTHKDSQGYNMLCPKQLGEFILVAAGELPMQLRIPFLSYACQNYSHLLPAHSYLPK